MTNPIHPAVSQPGPERLYLQTARSLEKAIQDGTYRIGSRLPPERELAEELRVSRATIREAIIVLELRGLVQARQGSGIYVVATLPAETATTAIIGTDIGPFEVTEARRIIEGEIAALAAATITPAELEALDQLATEIGDVSVDAQRRIRADRAFHIALAASTRNDALSAIVTQLWDMRHSSPLCIYFFDRARELNPYPPFNEHRTILDAVRKRDAVAAREAMQIHLIRVTEALFLATEYDANDRARLKMNGYRHDFAERAGLKPSSACDKKNLSKTLRRRGRNG